MFDFILQLSFTFIENVFRSGLTLVSSCFFTKIISLIVEDKDTMNKKVICICRTVKKA